MLLSLMPLQFCMRIPATLTVIKPVSAAETRLALSALIVLLSTAGSTEVDFS